MEASDSLRQKKIKFFCPILDTSTCNASHSLYQNGRVPYGRKSSSIYYGTRSYRCNNGSNHIGELTRIENEIARRDSMVSNWCKTEKITISKEIGYCKPFILDGLQKNNKKLALTT